MNFQIYFQSNKEKKSKQTVNVTGIFSDTKKLLGTSQELSRLRKAFESLFKLYTANLKNS